jgi:GMP synthase (glutamine-hydrolysing)
VPVLGICYGVQLMGHFLDGEVEHSKEREYGHGVLTIQKPGRLFADLPKKLRVWNSHGDKLTKLPPGFRAIGTTRRTRRSRTRNGISTASSFIRKFSTPNAVRI